jgi:DNA (cytosine-5)-methyltransferase 1
MRDRLNVIWLYQPDQTILKGAPYPFKGEIFFSDHCSCDEMPALRRHEVVATFSVTFFCGPGVSGTEFFIRQKFLTATGSFVTMHQKDLNECGCEFESDPYLDVMGKFKVGDTVLIKANAPSTEQNKKNGKRKLTKVADTLEPSIVLAFIEEEKKVRVRVFYRRGRDFKGMT